MPKKIKSAETRKKISEARKREWKTGIRKGGWKHSEATKKKMSEAKKGKKLSKEHRKNLSIAGKGRKLTEEHKRKISESEKGKICSEETRRKMSNSRRGKKSYLWKNGNTKINKIIKNSLEYRLWREKVFKRDNCTCQKCKNRGTIPHHKKPFYKIIKENKIETLEDALKCKELWGIDNGETLCKDCHKLTDSYGFKIINN